MNYCVYGLLLESNVELSGLQSCKAAGEKIDVTATMGDFPGEIERLFHHSMPQRYYAEPGYIEGDPPRLVVNTLADGQYYHFSYAVGVQFVCDKLATSVWGRWQDPLTLMDATLFLVGPILGFMLRLQGVTCLHASGVVIEGRALAITGPSGSGKSTLAAAFAAAGFPILSDDILPLQFEQGSPQALPGYSRLRLYPRSFKGITQLPDDLPALSPHWSKCYLDVGSAPYSFHHLSIPLHVVYFLDWKKSDAAVSQIMPVKPISAVPLLAANTYRNEVLDSDMRKKEFFFLSQLASKVTVRTIRMRDDLHGISNLVDVIRKDFKG
ncbi:hypothetical protein UWK_01350 [Desulfocapsa sulfexigens DSM 10523]|uniref:Serine kinase of the HPr protein, regulates carbohydrate metabolism n=1 Tax=Desulfocapsa sulfexigens (strain DSM 10523 / SB164P1) TaxID=1167006 RepID=M1PN99_DESSD|nr:hypothetical protein [Desulfocapsa sulfexigens]AGF77911.1 hypothetical protein UWK_01350 [Desulfocapsa sulfexigens DSM 10523]